MIKITNSSKSTLLCLVAFFLTNFVIAQTTSIPDDVFEDYLETHDANGNDVIIGDPNSMGDGIENNNLVLTSRISGVTSLNITSYDIIDFQGLGDFTSINSFTMYDNQSSDLVLNFNSNPSIETIHITLVPNLIYFDVSGVNNLVNLLLAAGNSSTLNPNLDLDFSNNNNLQSIFIRTAKVESILFGDDNNSLESIDLSLNNIQFIDVSELQNLNSLNVNGNNLISANLKNGNNAILNSVQLDNNPTLTCILVDDVTFSESATDWNKDATATYVENAVSIITEPQDIPIQYDSSGNYQTEINNWLANNGGAEASSDCGEVTWSYNVFEFFASSNNNRIVYGVEFTVTDTFGNTDSSVLDLTVSNINHFNTDFYGTGDTICDDTYNLNKAITDIEPEASLILDDIVSYNFSRESNFEFNEGPSGTTFSGTDVDFPDTGAGSYSYLFKVSIQKSLNVYDPMNDQFVNETNNEEANITLNDKTVAFKVEALDDINVCPGEISSMQDLTDMLVITPDPNVYEPQAGPIDLNQFWDESIYSGSGTYTFNPTDAFINCPTNDVSITVTEEVELEAGDDVFDAEDDNSYVCGDTVSFNLNSYLDTTADSGGKWYDSGNNLLANGTIDFPDTGAGSFTKSFKYRQENNNCGFFSEANYEISYIAEGFSVGNSTTLNVCEGEIVTEQDLINALGAEEGGFWDVIIDSNNVGEGLFTYSHGDCSTEGDSTIEVIEETPLSAGTNGTLVVDIGLINLVEYDDLFDALGGNPDLGGVWSPELTGSGIYTYTHAATAFCPESSATVELSEETLTINDADLDKISIYPNPSSNYIFIKGNTQRIKRIEIYTITGQRVLDVKKHFETIDIQSLISGVYFVKMNTANATKTVKLIKK